MIKVQNISKQFGNKKVLDNVSFDIPNGQKVAIIGPSGCGKSTLLRLIIRLDEPTSGAIYVDDVSVSRLKEEKTQSVRSKIGMVFQSSALFDSMNVFENVAFGLRQQNKYSEEKIREKVSEKLAMAELPGTENMMPGELSGGMQKRISLARAIAADPEIVLYDEPTTGLDPVTSTVIEDLINKLTSELHATAIVVTHQLSTIFRTSDRIIMLHDGKLIEAGNVEETRKSQNPIVRNFITGGIKA